MHTLNYITDKYNLDLEGKLPIEIPNTSRETLANLFKELGFKTGVEVGVLEGVYSEVLLQANPKLELYGVDPWVFYETAGNFRSQRQLDKCYDIAVKKLTPYKNYTIIKKSSMGAVKDFEDKSLDFVYIDANHEYSYVLEDIVEWSKKVRPGGIVAGHDYRLSKSEKTKLHVVYALNDYVKMYKIKHWFILGRKKVFEGEIRDKYRSWFWVN